LAIVRSGQTSSAPNRKKQAGRRSFAFTARAGRSAAGP
jgi:hypothetical protein